MKEKDFDKTELKTIFAFMCLVIKMGWFFQFMIQIKNLDSIDLLLLIDDDKSNYANIKDFNRFMFHKTKIKTKNGFVEVAYNFL